AADRIWSRLVEVRLPTGHRGHWNPDRATPAAPGWAPQLAATGAPLTMSRWMLWHRLHCSVQYSDALRPPNTRSTDNRPRHSGQCDRTAIDGWDKCPVSSCVIGAPSDPV